MKQNIHSGTVFSQMGVVLNKCYFSNYDKNLNDSI